MHDVAVGLEALWSLVTRGEMVLTLEPLVPFHGIFKLELDFGVVRRELKADFVDEFRGKSEVAPALQILVPLVLQLVLPPLVELDHHVADVVRHTLVPHVVNHGFLEIVGHDREWLWLWRR